MPDIIPNEELRAFMVRWYAAWQGWDFETLKEMMSADPCFLSIGTDPGEWWGGEDFLSIWKIQAREMGQVKVRASSRLSAHSCGNVGWVADEPIMTLPNGTEIAGRLTGVAVIERGHWRIVQWHVSLGKKNEEMLGMVLTTSIDDVERSVRVERPDVRPASAPDGTVTIVFSDVESSTVLLDRLGDAGFVRMLAWHDRIVREVAEEHRGYVVKSQGDGFMLAYPSAAFALRASLVTRDRMTGGFEGLPIRIRAGLHSGEAIKHDDDFYGRTVVIAARISALALGGEILASDLVYALARGLGMFTFGEPRSTTLKGFEGSFELRPVLN
ncbi:MAG TPA: nuclear transport factor 2 family protein [Casimicrobiaceae bacterium]